MGTIARGRKKKHITWVNSPKQKFDQINDSCHVAASINGDSTVAHVEIENEFIVLREVVQSVDFVAPKFDFGEDFISAGEKRERGRIDKEKKKKKRGRR